MTQEVELKLTLPPAAAAAFAARPMLAGARPRRVPLDAAYFDTADRLLARHGMALRVRRSGTTWVQTLKTAATRSHGGLTARPEIDMPAHVLRGVPTLNRARLAATPAGELLARQARPPRLLPVFRVRVQRTAWDVRVGASLVEVVLDRGRIEAQRDGRRVTEAVSEVELELKSGRAEDLMTAALRLIGAGATGLPLVPSVRGKAERGHLLAAGKRPPTVKAAARGFVQGLAQATPASSALRAVLAHGLNVLLANTEALHAAHEPEYVHQARVALRRMRSALRLFDRAHADFPAALSLELAWAGRLLGAARDLDVLADETLPALLAQAPQAAAHADDLRSRIAAARETARGRALAGLASARFARLALRLQAWTLSPPPAARTLAKLAPRRLDRAHARLFEEARFFVAQTTEHRHAVRILAKRLRYALDLFAVALPAEATAQYIEALAELQDVLGTLNDGAVGQQALATFGAAPELVEWARNELAARELPLAVEAERRLLALHGIAPPWRRAEARDS
jgi:inorganic triphosphatase YgiF